LLVLTTSWPRCALDPGGRFVEESCAALVAAGATVTVHPLEPGISLDGAQVEPLCRALPSAPGGLPARLRSRPDLALRVLPGLLAGQPRWSAADRVLCHWAAPMPLLAQWRGVPPERLRTWCHGSGLRLPGAALWLGRRHPLALVAEHQRAALPRRFRPGAVVLPVPVLKAPSAALAPAQTLVFVGRLVGQKGAGFIPKILDALPGWNALVIGDGPLRSKLQADPRINALGPLLRGVWQRSLVGGVGICPAAGPEGAPLVVDELRASGLPVVVADQPGLAQTVRHGVDGLVVAGRDPQVWAAAVRRAQACSAPFAAHRRAPRGSESGYAPLIAWVSGGGELALELPPAFG
jgi:glycosyltransferase involved in cell wall biosynthesis